MKVIPILRIFDYDKTIQFYVDWLGGTIDWIHEFEPDVTPKFMQYILRDMTLYLSEHHGDGTPGTHLHVQGFTGLKDYHAVLIEKQFKFGRPGLEKAFWDENTITVTVHDPFGNQLLLSEKLDEAES